MLWIDVLIMWNNSVIILHHTTKMSKTTQMQKCEEIKQIFKLRKTIEENNIVQALDMLKGVVFFVSNKYINVEFEIWKTDSFADQCRNAFISDELVLHAAFYSIKTFDFLFIKQILDSGDIFYLIFIYLIVEVSDLVIDPDLLCKILEIMIDGECVGLCLKNDIGKFSIK